MKLNRHNYEEYFILYLDNELNAEDRREVESFVQNNPDLKTELDLLLGSRLSPDTQLVFDNKQALLFRDSSSISLGNYEEWLLNYTDNELTAKERKDVEAFVAAHPELAKELSLFEKVKLQPEFVIFPDKNTLYRKERKAPVVDLLWKRMAAAAAILFLVSMIAYYFINKEDNNTHAPVVSTEPKKEIIAPIDTREPKEEIAPSQQEALVSVEEKTEQPRITPSHAVAEEQEVMAKRAEDKKTAKDNPVLMAKNDQAVKSNNLPEPTKENPYVNPEIKKADQILAKNDPAPLTNTKEIEVPQNVTPKVINTSIPISPDEESDINKQGGKRGGLRGFLRKVTRNIEKRTNIKTTDDDDRLLIAGLAIKLN